MIVYERAYSSELKVMVLATHEQRHWRVIAEIKTKHFPVKIYVEALWVEYVFLYEINERQKTSLCVKLKMYIFRNLITKGVLKRTPFCYSS